MGQRVVVWSQDGPVPGVISRKAIHLLTDDEKKAVVQPKDMWIDIGISKAIISAETLKTQSKLLQKIKEMSLSLEVLNLLGISYNFV